MKRRTIGISVDYADRVRYVIGDPDLIAVGPYGQADRVNTNVDSCDHLLTGNGNDIDRVRRRVGYINVRSINDNGFCMWTSKDGMPDICIECGCRCDGGVRVGIVANSVAITIRNLSGVQRERVGGIDHAIAVIVGIRVIPYTITVGIKRFAVVKRECVLAVANPVTVNIAGEYFNPRVEIGLNLIRRSTSGIGTNCTFN